MVAPLFCTKTCSCLFCLFCGHCSCNLCSESSYTLLSSLDSSVSRCRQPKENEMYFFKLFFCGFSVSFLWTFFGVYFSKLRRSESHGHDLNPNRALAGSGIACQLSMESLSPSFLSSCGAVSRDPSLPSSVFINIFI